MHYTAETGFSNEISYSIVFNFLIHLLVSEYKYLIYSKLQAKINCYIYSGTVYRKVCNMVWRVDTIWWCIVYTIRMHILIIYLYIQKKRLQKKIDEHTINHYITLAYYSSGNSRLSERKNAANTYHHYTYISNNLFDLKKNKL